MAHTRTRHPLSLWTGKQVAETGLDRLVVLTWKGNEKTGRVAHSARCFSVPRWTPELDGKDKAFVEMLVDTVEQKQKATAHKYVTEFMASNNNVCNDIPAEILEPNKILADWLEEDNDDGSRGKLSGDAIGAWFTDVLSDMVMASMADKNGWMDQGYQLTDAQTKTLKQNANSFRVTLERLAAPQPNVNIETAKVLKKAVDLLGDTKDTVAKKLDRKLDAILNPVVKESGMSLADLL